MIYLQGKTSISQHLSKSELVEDIMGGELSDPNGFDLRDSRGHGIIELCVNASDAIYYRIDEDNVFSKVDSTDGKFGDGVTSLADRTVCLRPGASGITRYWYKANAIVLDSSVTVQLDDASQVNSIVLDGVGDLKVVNDTYIAIMGNVPVAVVMINVEEGKKIVFANTRHGKEMSSATRYMLQKSIGSMHDVGLSIKGIVDNGTTFDKIEAGIVLNEDVMVNIDDVYDAPFVYRGSDGNWVLETDSNGDVVTSNVLAFTNDGSADAVYNRDNGDGSWDLVDTGSDYVVMHIFTTGDGEYPIFKLVGQNLYTTRSKARVAIDSEIFKIQADGLPVGESCYLYAYILDGKGAIEKGSEGQVYVDYRRRYPVDQWV